MIAWRMYAKGIMRSRARCWRLLLVALVLYVTWQGMMVADYTRNEKALTIITKAEKLETVGTPNTRVRQSVSRLKGSVDYPKLGRDGSQKAILLSYMRGGTTFVGSAFERNKDIFYVFEPEWALIFQTMNEYQPLKYLDGTIQDPVWIDDGDETIERLIQNYLYCNISGIDVVSLYQRFMLEGQYTKPLYDCLRANRIKSLECVKNFTEVCASKNFHFLKTVRLRVHTIENLLTSDPSLRIIHMIRDPRGIAQSRRGWAEFYSAKETFTFGRVCAEILRDIESVENLPPEVANRVLPVLYEEVAENPESMVEYLYNFAKMPYTDSIREYVRKITHASKDIRSGFSIDRENSSKTAYSWRSQIDWTLSSDLDIICDRVYKKIGYLPAESEKVLRDYNISLRYSDISGLYLDKFRKFPIPRKADFRNI